MNNIDELKAFYNDHKGSYIQTFDDSKQGRKELITCAPITEWFPKWQQLKDLNMRGAGIFITPNPCKGGRKEENITERKYIYVDIDDESKEWALKRQGEAALPPTVVIESKRSYHFWYAIKGSGIQIEQWQLAQDGLNQYFHGDLAISSPNEVLRAPNFEHYKDPANPFTIRLDSYTPEWEFTIEELIAAFPYVPPIIASFKGTGTPDNEIEQIKKIPIEDVLHDLGVEVKHGFIWENGEQTSAHVMRSGNFITRFSGKPGSGSTIDAVMGYGNKTKAEAIKWLKDKAGIVPQSLPTNFPKQIGKRLQAPYTWGTRELDRKITPIDRQHYILFAGQTGSGKTAFTFDMACKNADLGHGVLYISLEMTREQLIDRQCRIVSAVTKEQWREKNISDIQLSIMDRIRNEMENKPNLTLYGFGKNDKTNLQSIIDVMLSAQPDLVLIDNLGMIESDGKEYENENNVSRTLSRFTSDAKIPVILLHHLNKASEKGGITSLADIRGSAKIFHDADTVILGKRMEYDEDASEEDRAVYTVSQRKDRDFGQLCSVNTYFKKGSFYDSFS